MTSTANPDCKLKPIDARFLTPDMCRIHLGPLEALHVTVEKEETYGGIIAVFLFPVQFARQFISLVHQTGDNEPDIEVGIIRDLDEFPPDQVRLIEGALARRYFIHTITHIRNIGWKLGFVSMDVDTDKGPVSFLMRWQTDRAANFGLAGKVLIDVNENRYLIPDLSALTPREQTAFTRIIYW